MKCFELLSCLQLPLVGSLGGKRGGKQAFSLVYRGFGHGSETNSRDQYNFLVVRVHLGYRRKRRTEIRLFKLSPGGTGQYSTLQGQNE